MTRTDIANMALKAIGAGRIEDINDIDDTATSCRDQIDVAVQDYGNTVVSNALVSRRPLVPTGVAVDGYSSSYAFPTAPPMLRPLRLESGAAYYREGGLLHTNDPAAVLVYVRSDFDAPDLPTYAAEAIAMKLALLIVSDLGKDERLGTVAQLYHAAIAKAKAIEGRSLNPDRPKALWGDPR